MPGDVGQLEVTKQTQQVKQILSPFWATGIEWSCCLCAVWCKMESHSWHGIPGTLGPRSPFAQHAEHLTTGKCKQWNSQKTANESVHPACMQICVCVQCEWGLLFQHWKQPTLRISSQFNLRLWNLEITEVSWYFLNAQSLLEGKDSAKTAAGISSAEKSALECNTMLPVRMPVSREILQVGLRVSVATGHKWKWCLVEYLKGIWLL